MALDQACLHLLPVRPPPLPMLGVISSFVDRDEPKAGCPSPASELLNVWPSGAWRAWGGGRRRSRAGCLPTPLEFVLTTPDVDEDPGEALYRRFGERRRCTTAIAVVQSPISQRPPAGSTGRVQCLELRLLGLDRRRLFTGSVAHRYARWFADECPATSPADRTRRYLLPSKSISLRPGALKHPIRAALEAPLSTKDRRPVTIVDEEVQDLSVRVGDVADDLVPPSATVRRMPAATAAGLPSLRSGFHQPGLTKRFEPLAGEPQRLPRVQTGGHTSLLPRSVPTPIETTDGNLDGLKLSNPAARLGSR